MEHDVVDAHRAMDKENRIIELERQFDRLRPSAFSGILGFMTVWAVFLFFYYFERVNDESYMYFLVLSVCLGIVTGESYRINKRIDALAKLNELMRDE